MSTYLQMSQALETVRGAELDASQVIAFVTAEALVECSAQLTSLATSLELIEARQPGG